MNKYFISYKLIDCSYILNNIVYWDSLSEENIKKFKGNNCNIISIVKLDE